MTSINGNNKNERNITKAKKYFDIDLVEQSNKYYKIVNKKDLKGFYIIKAKGGDIVKNGELVVIKPYKLSRPFFVKSWATLITSNNELIGKPYNDKDKEELEKLSKTCETLSKLESYPKVVFLKRASTFGNQV